MMKYNKPQRRGKFKTCVTGKKIDTTLCNKQVETLAGKMIAAIFVLCNTCNIHQQKKNKKRHTNYKRVQQCCILFHKGYQMLYQILQQNSVHSEIT